MGACQPSKAGSADCLLQPARCPDMSGVGSAALDVGRCGVLEDQVSKQRFVSTQSLRELKQVLEPARLQAQAHTRPEMQHQYLQDAKGADAGITNPKETEPTSVICPSAVRAALDRPLIRCSTEDGAIAGAVTQSASKDSGRKRSRPGDVR